jgi:hypothetical protein
MHAVVRTYSGKGSKKLIDLIEKNKTEVERLIRSVKGFVSYSLVRTSRGGKHAQGVAIRVVTG